MDLEQRLRKSLVAPDPGAVFTARVMARVGRGRRRTGIMLAGTVLAVGAAAATLVWRMTTVSAPPVAASMPTVVEPEPVVAAPVVQATPEVIEAEVVVPQPAAPTQASSRYSVLLMPLRHEALELNLRGPVEAFHAAMLEELRKVPGLALQVQGGPVPGPGGQADYVLSIASLATVVSPIGGVMVRSTDGSLRCAENGGPAMACDNPLGIRSVSGISIDMDYGVDGVTSTFTTAGARGAEGVVWVEMNVESVHSAGTRYTWAMGAVEPTDQRHCDGENRMRPECLTPAQLAARQVETLRLQIFPPDPAFHQRVLAQLGSPGQDPAAGMRFQELMMGIVRGNGSGLDPDTLRALTKYLAGQPAGTRASAWNTLRQLSHPALVAPLLESLRNDPDRQVRLSALASLLASHSADPLVRRAFEEVDQDGSDPVVRAAVRRALYGPAQWRADLLAALDNTELAYDERLAPLLVNISSGTAQQDIEMSRVRQSVLREQQVLQPLIALIREHLHDAAQAPATSSALGSLAEVDDPAVFDFFLQLAREESLPPLVSMQVGSWAMNHQNDPRVRGILPQVDSVLPSILLRRMGEVTGSDAPGQDNVVPLQGSGSGAIITVTPPAQ